MVRCACSAAAGPSCWRVCQGARDGRGGAACRPWCVCCARLLAAARSKAACFQCCTPRCAASHAPVRALRTLGSDLRDLRKLEQQLRLLGRHGARASAGPAAGSKARVAAFVGCRASPRQRCARTAGVCTRAPGAPPATGRDRWTPRLPPGTRAGSPGSALRPGRDDGAARRGEAPATHLALAAGLIGYCTVSLLHWLAQAGRCWRRSVWSLRMGLKPALGSHGTEKLR